MKKLASYLVAVIACFAFAACSGDKGEKLEIMSLAASDDASIAVIDLNKVLDNAGCTINSDGSIESTKAITTLIRFVGDDGSKLFSQIINTKGADYSCMLVKITVDKCAVMAWQLTDQKAFESSLAEEWELSDSVKEDGYNVYAIEDDAKMYVGNEAAVIITYNESNPVALASIIAHCTENPLLDWQKATLCNPNACNWLTSMQVLDAQAQEMGGGSIFDNANPDLFDYDYEALKTGFVKIEADVEGPKLVAKAYALSSEGNVIESSISNLPVIDTALFKYAHADDMFAIGAAFVPGVNWMKYFDAIAAQMGGYPVQGIDRKTAKYVADVMADLDGTVLITAAPLNLRRIDNITSWQYVIVAEMKDGAAKKYLDLVYGKIADINRQYKLFLGEDMIKCTYTGSSLDVNLSAELQVHAKIVGKALVISSTPIADNGGKMLLDADYFHNQLIGAEATIDKDSKLIQGFKLPFQPTIAIAADGKEVDMAIAIDGDKKILDAVLTFIAGQM